jgi:hypothetical protein
LILKSAQARCGKLCNFWHGVLSFFGVVFGVIWGNFLQDVFGDFLSNFVGNFVDNFVDYFVGNFYNYFGPIFWYKLLFGHFML